LLGTAAAFGLASAAGLNTTLPLLLVGLLARAGLLQLAAPYDALASDVALIGLAVLATLEFSADKVPALDSVVQVLHWPLAATAGAILFASQNSVVHEVSPGLTIVIGVLLAGSVHALRSAARPAINVSTFGLGGPVVSLVEDLVAVGLTMLAALAPLVGLVALALLVYLAARLVDTARRRLAGRQTAAGP
jgi:hypothetical protein